MVIELDSKETFLITLEQNIHTSIECDLLSTNPGLSGESIVKIKRLLVYLSQQIPFKVDIAKIQRALSITDSRTIKTYLQLLENAGCIQMLYPQNKNLNGFEKPKEIYLENTNQIYALGGNSADLGNIRETFFINATSKKYETFYSEQGDFVVEGATFEVGRKGKTFRQTKGIENSFLAIDEIEGGINKKIICGCLGFCIRKRKSRGGRGVLKILLSFDDFFRKDSVGSHGQLPDFSVLITVDYAFPYPRTFFAWLKFIA